MSLGIHVDKDKNLYDSLVTTFGQIPKSKCAQIYLYGPRRNVKVGYDSDKIASLAGQYNLYSHSAFTVTWSNMPSMQDELNTAKELGIKGVVVHLQKDISPTEYIDKLSKIKIPNGVKLLLEMKAVAPGKWTYQSADEIIALIETLKNAKYSSSEIGICIDTAHVYTGKVPISTQEHMMEFLNKFNNHKEWIGLIHLNGNKNDCNKISRDEHIIPLHQDDKIWGGLVEHTKEDNDDPTGYERFKTDKSVIPRLEKTGCFDIITWASDNKIDIIMEIDKSVQLINFCNNCLENLYN